MVSLKCAMKKQYKRTTDKHGSTEYKDSEAVEYLVETGNSRIVGHKRKQAKIEHRNKAL